VDAKSEKQGRMLTDSSQHAHWHWAPQTDNWGNNTRSLRLQRTSYIALHHIPRRSRGPRVGGRMRSSWGDAVVVADPRQVRGTDNSTGLCSSFTATSGGARYLLARREKIGGIARRVRGGKREAKLVRPSPLSLSKTKLGNIYI
jgi:hypothetical protein